MIYAGNDNCTFPTQHPLANYGEFKHRHCQASLNQRRLMMALHSKYSKTEKFDEIYVEHPRKIAVDRELEKILGTTFFKTIIIQFLTTGILQSGGKIYLRFHPYVLKQLYHYNNGSYYKMTFEEDTDGYLQSNKIWSEGFSTTSNSEGVAFTMDYDIHYLPTKEHFETYFKKEVWVKDGKGGKRTINQSHYYARYWKNFEDEDLQRFHWILLTATDKLPDPKKAHLDY